MVPATGSFASPRTGLGVFNGIFRIAGLVSRGGSLALDGVFWGSLLDADGTHVGAAAATRPPVRVSTVDDNLELVVGPVEIDLLGFRVAIGELPVELPAETGDPTVVTSCVPLAAP